MRNILLLILTIILSFPLTSYSAFLDYGWGARPAGMGGAFTAVADDANAPLWNPAGIGRITNKEAMFMYAKPYIAVDNVNLGLNFASIVIPSNENVFGISWSNFSDANAYSENSFNLTYARFISESIFIGGNLKYLGHTYTTEDGFIDPVFDSGSKSKYAFDADAGLLFCLNSKLCVGASLRNILEPDIGLYDADVLPQVIRGGLAYHPSDDYIIALDVDYRDSKFEFFLGSELWLMNRMVGVRAGTNYRNDMLNEVTAGASYRQVLGKNSSYVKIDGCFVYPLVMAQNLPSVRIALTIGF